MKTEEFIKILANRLDKTEGEVTYYYSLLVGACKNHLTQNNMFTIPGIGSFGTVERDEREMFSENLEAIIQVPKRVVPVFRATKSLNTKINISAYHEQES